MIKKHWISIVTLIIAVIVSIVINCVAEISIFENIILTLVILLIVTFIFDFSRALDQIHEKQESYEGRLNKSSVKDFKTINNCVDRINMILLEKRQEGHSVDFVALDKFFRLTDNPMSKLLKKINSDNEIAFRFLTAINSKSYYTVLQLMYESFSCGHSSSYALCKAEIPFASFFIVDKKYLVIRTPCDSDKRNRHYDIIIDDDIVALFQSWYEVLWRCKKTYIIDTEEDLIDTLENIKSNIGSSETEIGDITNLMGKVINKLIEQK